MSTERVTSFFRLVNCRRLREICTGSYCVGNKHPVFLRVWVLE